LVKSLRGTSLAQFQLHINYAVLHSASDPWKLLVLRFQFQALSSQAAEVHVFCCEDSDPSHNQHGNNYS